MLAVNQVLVPGINGDIRTTLFDSHIKIGTENVETIYKKATDNVKETFSNFRGSESNPPPKPSREPEFYDPVYNLFQASRGDT